MSRTTHVPTILGTYRLSCPMREHQPPPLSHLQAPFQETLSFPLATTFRSAFQSAQSKWLFSRISKLDSNCINSFMAIVHTFGSRQTRMIRGYKRPMRNMSIRTSQERMNISWLKNLIRKPTTHGRIRNFIRRPIRRIPG